MTTKEEIKHLNDRFVDHFGLTHQLGKLEEELVEALEAVRNYNNNQSLGNELEMILELGDVSNLMEQVIRDMCLTGVMEHYRLKKLRERAKKYLPNEN